MSIHERDYDSVIICTTEKWDGSDSFKASGVWALYGKAKSRLKDEVWVCLQVGKAKSILPEVLADCDLINSDENLSLNEKPYINQFGEKCFDYNEYSSCREHLYRHIKERYADLVFVCVCLEDDEEKRKSKESDFAWLTHSKFWRNGGVFKAERNNYYRDTYDSSRISLEVKAMERRILKALNEYDKTAHQKTAASIMT